MLKQDEIKKRLEGIKRVDEWIKARVDRLGRAKQTTREVGLLLMGCDPANDGKRQERYWQQQGEGEARLAELDAEQLLALGEAMFLSFVDVFHTAWRMH